LDATGLISKIADATLNIDAGRKGFATRGKEAEESFDKIKMKN